MSELNWSGSEGYAGHIGVVPSGKDKLDWHPAPPKRVGDAPAAGLCKPISQRAADALHNIRDRHPLPYPVVLNDASDPYYMVALQTVVDAQGRDHSVPACAIDAAIAHVEACEGLGVDAPLHRQRHRMGAALGARMTGRRKRRGRACSSGRYPSAV